VNIRPSALHPQGSWAAGVDVFVATGRSVGDGDSVDVGEGRSVAEGIAVNVPETMVPEMDSTVASISGGTSVDVETTPDVHALMINKKSRAES